MRSLIWLFTIVQLLLAFRVWLRMLKSAGGTRIRRTQEYGDTQETVSLLLPVLNEVERVGPCLESLAAQPDSITEILVIDGGSVDGTQSLVRDTAQRDKRVRLIEIETIPDEVNGKAFGLEHGLRESDSATDWILNVDADVRLDAAFTSSLLNHARAERVNALSVATSQLVSGSVLALIHPSMLATLVYRYGIPGSATTRVEDVQANGQCFLVRRDLLTRVGGFAHVFDSVCEDVTLAREIASLNEPVGFYETDGLATVEMYTNWKDAWENWTRSLPMRDRYWTRANYSGLAELLLVQSLPTLLLPVWIKHWGMRHPATRMTMVLASTRLGVLIGTARAYPHRPWTYWLSPLVDLLVSLKICQMALRKKHTWRGRHLTPGESR